MAPKNPKIEIIHGKTKYMVFQKITGLVPRTEAGEEADYIIVGPEKEGAVNVVVLANRDLNEEELALRVKWFADTRPKCVKCGAAYSGKNYMEVVAIRNGTRYLDVRCDRCEPRITWLSAMVIGRS
jgi:DNA-directed RNA polymerase subunit RPC12/RpoP